MKMRWIGRRIQAVLAVFILLLLVFGFGGRVLAAETNYVYDEAALLSEAEIENLEEMLNELQQRSGWNVYAVTTADAGGKSAGAYADDFFDAHSLNQEDGAALLIDMDNREIYLSTCGEAIRYLTDERVDRILDEAYRYVSNGDYAGCLTAMAEGVADYYERGIPRDQYNYDVNTGQVSVYHSLTMGEILTAAVAALAVGGIFYGATVGKYQLKFGNWQYPFREHSTMNLWVQEDRLVNRFVTHRRIPRQNPNPGRGGGRSGGRSSTHRSSSGRSHGGGGRRF